MTAPSIYNDVLGPVMRGPSSSHCAAALRIGRICRDLMGGKIENALIEFDPRGSLATTHKGQGSDMGLFGGFLGWEAHDDRLPHYETAIAESGMNIHIGIRQIGASHPNTYKMTLSNGDCQHKVTAISTGGGMIEIVELDGASLSLYGDYYELITFCSDRKEVIDFYNLLTNVEEVVHVSSGDHIVIAHMRQSPESSEIEKLLQIEGVTEVRVLDPVLPVLSNKNGLIPFNTADKMLEFGKVNHLNIWELAQMYECERGGLTMHEVGNKMEELLSIFEVSMQEGLDGTHYEDRILGSQSQLFKKEMKRSALLPGDLLNQVVLHVSAIMEVKSAMGVIIAAPTAGSCGVVPGTLLGTMKTINATRESMLRAMFAAGIVGVFITRGATFAAEVGGCQAECGAASSMAAAGLVSMIGGTLEQSLSAASFALQNSLGMICDPIANRVEAPCLGKNIMAASNAISCANMALAGYDHLIPLEQVIGAMNEVSKKMTHHHRCTGLGGLAITKAAKEIENRMNPGYVIANPEDIGEVSRFFKVC